MPAGDYSLWTYRVMRPDTEHGSAGCLTSYTGTKGETTNNFIYHSACLSEREYMHVITSRLFKVISSLAYARENSFRNQGC